MPLPAHDNPERPLATTIAQEDVLLHLMGIYPDATYPRQIVEAIDFSPRGIYKTLYLLVDTGLVDEIEVPEDESDGRLARAYVLSDAVLPSLVEYFGERSQRMSKTTRRLRKKLD